MATSPEIVLWEGRPALRIVVPYILFVIFFLISIFLLMTYNMGTVVAGAILLILSIILSVTYKPFSTQVKIYDALFLKYKLTNQRILITEGFISKTIRERDLVYFVATGLHQHTWALLLGIGDVLLQGKDDKHPSMSLVGISQSFSVKELARTAMIARYKELGMNWHRIT
jgi:hypothetical protein